MSITVRIIPYTARKHRTPEFSRAARRHPTYIARKADDKHSIAASRCNELLARQSGDGAHAPSRVASPPVGANARIEMRPARSIPPHRRRNDEKHPTGASSPMTCYAARWRNLNLWYCLSAHPPTLAPVTQPNTQVTVSSKASARTLNHPSPNDSRRSSHENRLRFVTAPQMRKCLPATQHTMRGQRKRLIIAIVAKQLEGRCRGDISR